MNNVVLIESHEENEIAWIVSFNGPNPEADQCVRCYNKVEAEKLCRLLKGQE